MAGFSLEAALAEDVMSGSCKCSPPSDGRRGVSQNRRAMTVAVCALGALVLGVVDASLVWSDSSAAQDAALFLALLAAVLGGVAVRLLMPRTAWRVVLVPFVALLVFLPCAALFVTASGQYDGSAALRHPVT